MKELITKQIMNYLNDSGLSVNALRPHDMLFETGALDSFSMVELITFLENKYSMRFSADDLKREYLESVDKIVELISNKMELKRHG